GVEETAALGNADIRTHNAANIVYDNTIINAANAPIPNLVAANVGQTHGPNFTALPDPNSTQPVVVVSNILNVNLYNQNNGTSFPWPDIRIMSPADMSPNGSNGIGIGNDAGYVILATASNGLGAL